MEPVAAATDAAAGADPFDHFGLVSDADLPQLDARTEFLGQIPDVSAKIDALLGSEIQEQLLRSFMYSTSTSFMSRS